MPDKLSSEEKEQLIEQLAKSIREHDVWNLTIEYDYNYWPDGDHLRPVYTGAIKITFDLLRKEEDEDTYASDA